MKVIQEAALQRRRLQEDFNSDHIGNKKSNRKVKLKSDWIEKVGSEKKSNRKVKLKSDWLEKVGSEKNIGNKKVKYKGQTHF